MTRRTPLALLWLTALSAACNRTPSTGTTPAASATPSASSAASATGQALTADDLLSAPDAHLGKHVTVDIVEPLQGPRSPEALRAVPMGQVPVNLRNLRTGTLTLVPSTFVMSDENRYRAKFDQVLSAPLRIEGDFLRDEKLSTPTRPAYVLRVTTLTPLPAPAPTPATLAEITASPATWDRRLVSLEGTFSSGFEESLLDGKVWITLNPGAITVGSPPGTPSAAPSAPLPRHRTTARVRATGRLFARPGSTHGHLGMAPFELVVDRMEYLPQP